MLTNLIIKVFDSDVKSEFLGLFLKIIINHCQIDFSSLSYWRRGYLGPEILPWVLTFTSFIYFTVVVFCFLVLLHEAKTHVYYMLYYRVKGSIKNHIFVVPDIILTSCCETQHECVYG